ncbi:hypothetical protein QN277_022785 [Acacia crassicarpa]|uniref:Uncharacterized protein n=1 Tax=Acacia crassicarpa TaxID=499986 RepID=A0AAE1JIN0_9FABA|nr:hypothetical protein QN277_022785 [Acacia crassicarpa]
MNQSHSSHLTLEYRLLTSQYSLTQLNLVAFCASDFISISCRRHHSTSPPSSELLAVVDLGPRCGSSLHLLLSRFLCCCRGSSFPSSPQPFCLISTLRSRVLFDRLSDEGLETSHFQFQS